MHSPHDLQPKACDGILQYTLTAVSTDASLNQLLQLNGQLVGSQIDNLVEGSKSSGGYDHTKAIFVLFVCLYEVEPCM